MKKTLLLLTLLIAFNSYSQLTLTPNGNGIVNVSYGSSGDWTLYNPYSDPVILYLWVPETMNSQNISYADNWNGTLISLTWNGTEHAGSIDFNTHSFDGIIIPLGTSISNFQLILRNPAGTSQSGNLLASDYGYSTTTLSTEDFSTNSISINCIENFININGLEYNQKFNIDVFDLSGKLVKQMDEKSALDIQELTQAVYILKLKTDNDQTLTKKIVKI
ncbi:T9SS type A sorting domain-containing protein [Lutibacter sp.]|uniref:T9SS type A sorting domain-containing protein n=1 Tax=Lutibacter sp. TaxID=1925666 RepID=UPI00356B3994